MSLKSLRCRLFGGHLPITQFGKASVKPTCYLCGAALSQGWELSDRKPPKPSQGFIARLVRGRKAS